MITKYSSSEFFQISLSAFTGSKLLHWLFIALLTELNSLSDGTLVTTMGISSALICSWGDKQAFQTATTSVDHSLAQPNA